MTFKEDTHALKEDTYASKEDTSTRKTARINKKTRTALGETCLTPLQAVIVKF